MGLIASAVAVSVTIAGTPMPLAVVSDAVESLAPEVDSCTLVVEWGDRRISGSANPAETMPALGAEVVISTASGYEWRGHLMSRRRIASGSRRRLMLQAMGPGIHADRSYLPTFARYGLSGVYQAPGAPRFAPGTRSAAADGPGTTYVLGGNDNWTVGQALAAMVAHAPEAGLPTITLDAGSADLTRTLPDTDGDGISYFATIQAIVGHRMGLVWRLQLTASGWVLRVRDAASTGTELDLTGGDITDYDVGEDVTAALADLEVRGSRKRYVFDVDAYTSGSGDLDPDWSSGDVTARSSGDYGSPAFRRFRITTFALPDGSASTLATPVPTLPISNATTLTEGSSSWLVFAQLTAGSTWISLQGRVSISVQGLQVWIEGIDPTEWATWNRIRVTMCMSPRGYVSATRTGGAGLGRGLAIVGNRHVYASSASVRVTGGGGLSTVSGSPIDETDPIDEAADALWSSLGVAQWSIAWTRSGVISTADTPGTRKTSVVLPVPGSTPTTVACDCIVTSRRVVWSGGRPSTTWTAAPRPFATGAIAR